MTHSHGNDDQPQKERVLPGTPAHQREDQPLKEMNEDPEESEDSENGTDDAAKQNAQGDHAGSAHDPAAFHPGGSARPDVDK